MPKPGNKWKTGTGQVPPPRDRAEQIAALPLRWDKTGQPRVLMVTSRDTGRWVMPKGWPMDGKKPWRAAEIEALEEAGAKGFVSTRAIGVYRYVKRRHRGGGLECRVTVYPMIVDRLKERWKERKDRKRHWFSLKKAARLVAEKDLAALLGELAANPSRLQALVPQPPASRKATTAGPS